MLASGFGPASEGLCDRERREMARKLTNVLLGVHHAQLTGQGAQVDQEVEVPRTRKFEGVSGQVRAVNGRERSD